MQDSQNKMSNIIPTVKNPFCQTRDELLDIGQLIKVKVFVVYFAASYFISKFIWNLEASSNNYFCQPEEKLQQVINKMQDVSESVKHAMYII